MNRIKTVVALVLAAIMAFSLTGCNFFTNCENTEQYECYEGYKGIIDFGIFSGASEDAKAAATVAKRLGVDAKSVKAYKLNEETLAKVPEWEAALKENEFSKKGELAEKEYTTFLNKESKTGAVAGMLSGNDDTLVVLLVNKDSYSDYLSVSGEELQKDWGNFNSEKPYFINKKKIYGFGYLSSKSGFLVKNTDSSDPEMIMPEVCPSYICEKDNYIYTCLENVDGAYSSKLYRYDTKEKDKEAALEMLSKGDVSYLSLQGEYLYYCKTKATDDGFKTTGFYRSDLDGKNEETIINKETYDNYKTGTKVYYRNGSDNGEHVYDLLTGSDEQITEKNTYHFFTDGSRYGYYIYYDEAEETKDDLDAEDEEEQESDLDIKTAELTSNDLVQIDLTTGETKILAECLPQCNILGVEDRIYFSNSDEDEKVYCVYKDGGFRRITRDEYVGKIMTYHDLLVYFTYADDDYKDVDKIYICNLDGSTRIELTR